MKKFDDLRKSFSQWCSNTFRFYQVLHDEYAKQSFCDTFVMSKLVAADGKYTAYGDPKQMQTSIDNDFFDCSASGFTGPFAAFAHQCSMDLQCSLWEKFLAYKKTHKLTGTCLQTAAKMVNRRSHPNIVTLFSNAFYNGEMKASLCWSGITPYVGGSIELRSHFGSSHFGSSHVMGPNPDKNIGYPRCDGYKFIFTITLPQIQLACS